MRKLTRGILLALLVLIASLSIPHIIASAQVEPRVVHILYPNDCPVKIRALKVAERPIEPQKTFAAGEDWLKSLSWEVENTWEKSADYVEIDLHFHGLAALEDSVFKYRYGQGTNTPGDLDETKLLRPGQRTRMIISDEEYVRIRRFIETREPNFSTSVVEMKVAKVVFEDATVWP